MQLNRGEIATTVKQRIENNLNKTYHRTLRFSPYEVVFRVSRLDPFRKKIGNVRQIAKQKTDKSRLEISDQLKKDLLDINSISET